MGFHGEVGANERKNWEASRKSRNILCKDMTLKNAYFRYLKEIQGDLRKEVEPIEKII